MQGVFIDHYCSRPSGDRIRALTSAKERANKMMQPAESSKIVHGDPRNDVVGTAHAVA
jgi:hypothetical protein